MNGVIDYNWIGAADKGSLEENLKKFCPLKIGEDNFQQD